MEDQLDEVIEYFLDGPRPRTLLALEEHERLGL
jgi:hypothetical protein